METAVRYFTKKNEHTFLVLVLIEIVPTIYCLFYWLTSDDILRNLFFTVAVFFALVVFGTIFLCITMKNIDPYEDEIKQRREKIE